MKKPQNMGELEGLDMRLYRGDNPYKEVGRTYRSASEAFKDADYATPIWRCETRFERDWRIVKGWAGVILGIGLAYVIAFAFVDWLKRG